MKPIKFQKYHFDHHVEYHLPTDYSVFIEESILYREFLLEDNLKEDWNAYLYQEGLTSFGSEENALLYAFLLGKLSEGKTIQMISFGNPKEPVVAMNTEPPIKIEWRYSIEFTVDDGDRCRDFGFLNPKEFLNAVDYYDKRLSHRYFYITKVDQETLKHFMKLFHSDVTNWSFIIGNSERAVKAFLQTKERPTLERFLRYADTIVNIQVGEDEGYYDYVQIISKENIDAQIELLEQQLTDFGFYYEAMLLELGAIDAEWKIEHYKSRLEALKKGLF